MMANLEPLEGATATMIRFVGKTDNTWINAILLMKDNHDRDKVMMIMDMVISLMFA